MKNLNLAKLYEIEEKKIRELFEKDKSTLTKEDFMNEEWEGQTISEIMEEPLNQMTRILMNNGWIEKHHDWIKYVDMHEKALTFSKNDLPTIKELYRAAVMLGIDEKTTIFTKEQCERIDLLTPMEKFKVLNNSLGIRIYSGVKHFNTDSDKGLERFISYCRHLNPFLVMIHVETYIAKK